MPAVLPDKRKVKTFILNQLKNAQGNPLGNTALMKKVQDEFAIPSFEEAKDLYYKVRIEMLEDGQVETGRGKGGSLKLSNGYHEAKKQKKLQFPAELSLYGPVKDVLLNDWVKAQNYAYLDYELSITAQQGRRSTGGKWTRPDITFAGCRQYKFIRGKQIDVVTFEIKANNDVTVSGVYEALSHRRSATKSYVLYYVPENERHENAEALEIILEEATRHHIGVYVAGDVADFGSWECLVEAEPHTPNPENLNDFITNQLPEMHDKILSWCR